MKQARNLSVALTLGEPIQLSYLAEGATHIKTGLPTDHTFQIGCEGAVLDYAPNFPMAQIVAYFDEVTI